MKIRILNPKFGVIAALLLVAIAPLILRKGDVVSPGDADERLVVITPHNETIQREFSEAFTRYWKEKTGKSVYIDWRTPGGTSEIRMVLDEQFEAAEEDDRSGVGIDVLFGGGDYLFRKLADEGRLTELDVFGWHPDWFKQGKGIPIRHTGELYYDEKKRWVGVCLTQFGICYNTDVLKDLGVPPLQTWDDLGDSRLFGKIAMADPTKSGSVARAFEMIIQQKIHNQLAIIKRVPGETAEECKLRGIRYGWADGLNLIQRISANSRYFTDSASKIPHDVAQGDAAAGMCVDFYGRSYNEKLKRADGSARLQWVAPKDGTSIGSDPVAIFKGAKNAELAQGFVEFLLSTEGQMIWCGKVGTSFGPRYHALRRLPIRPDMYAERFRKDFSDPELSPYTDEQGFVYEGGITEPVFGAFRVIIRSMCIDAHVELKAAWLALSRANFPQRARDHFHDVSIASYDKSMVEIRKELSSDRKLHLADVTKRMTALFRRNYKETQRLSDDKRN